MRRNNIKRLKEMADEMRAGKKAAPKKPSNKKAPKKEEPKIDLEVESEVKMVEKEIVEVED